MLENFFFRFTRPAYLIAFISTLAFLPLYLSSPLLADENDTTALSGPWLTHAGDDVHWGAASIDESKWQKVSMPGASAPAGFVWYRTTFIAPTSWESNTALVTYNRLNLNLGAFTGAVAIYVNGYLVNTVGTLPTNDEGEGFVPIPASDNVIVALPITGRVSATVSQPVIKFGAENELALRVYNSSAGPNPSSGKIVVQTPTLMDQYSDNLQSLSDDHLFTSTDQVKLSVTLSNISDKPAKASWTIKITDDYGRTPQGLPDTPQSDTVDPGKDIIYTLHYGLGRPGIYNVDLDCYMNDQQLSDKKIVVGYDVDKIHTIVNPPSDFDQFWASLGKQADTNPLNAQIAKVSDTGGVTAYSVRYDSIDGKPAYGWLSVPDKLPSKPIVIMHLPAYDSDATKPERTLSAQGYVVFEFMATADSLTSGNSGQGYLAQGIDDPKAYVMRTFVGNVLRAFRLLHENGSQAGVPSDSKIVLWGESQGGALALIAGGLLKNDVAAVLAISPYFSDMERNRLTTAKEENPFARFISMSPGNDVIVDKTLSYFDTTNFARQITAPTYMAVGLEDTIASVYGEYGTANNIPTPHLVDVFPGDGHVPSGASKSALAWLKSTVK